MRRLTTGIASRILGYTSPCDVQFTIQLFLSGAPAFAPMLALPSRVTALSTIAEMIGRDERELLFP